MSGKELSDYVDLRVPVSRAKKAELIALAKDNGQDLSNFLRPYLYRIATGELALSNHKRSPIK
jgi:hypothetical protein